MDVKISEEKLKKGNKAPDFSDYENYKGGTSSLSDFKGNYVYIDIKIFIFNKYFYILYYIFKISIFISPYKDFN